MADVTFPSVPVVISLLHYDDTVGAPERQPPAGYPVICVTVCIEFYAPSSVSCCVLNSVSVQNVHQSHNLIICVAECQSHYILISVTLSHWAQCLVICVSGYHSQYHHSYYFSNYVPVDITLAVICVTMRHSHYLVMCPSIPCHMQS